MISRKESIEIIDKLIELTHHGVINWGNARPNSYMVSQNSKVDTVYTTQHLGRNIRVYRRDYKYYLDDINYTWDWEFVVEFINDNNERMGQLPATPNSGELLEAIQYQNPQIKDFYKDMFGE